MAASSEKIKAAFQGLVDDTNKQAKAAAPDASYWKAHAADPSSLAFSSVLGSVYGADEVTAAVNLWLAGGIAIHPVGEIKVTSPGLGINFAEAPVKYTFTKEVLPGAPLEAKGTLTITATDDGKVTQISGYDAPELRETLIKLLGGGAVAKESEAAKAALEAMVANVKTLDAKQMAKDMADDVVFVDPNAAVKGKANVEAAVAQWFKLSLNGSKTLSAVRSVQPHTAFATVEYDFALPPESGLAGKKQVGPLFVKTNDAGKVSLVAALTGDAASRAFNATLLGFAAKAAGAA
ncbi:hypothetical protein DFJ74DRAFT_730584 [Hyaloraphidium curvatum]|nr:hypothetical protein DFJ74DRAFT_730584 [Hyaloraphidium curvatum]